MRQALRLTKEATPGVTPDEPSGSDVAHVRLMGDDAFPGRPMPNIVYVQDASSLNRRVAACYGTVATRGSIKTVAYFSQAKLLFPWMFNLVAAGASLKPAYTFTMDHLIQLEDDTTVVFRRYKGCYADDSTVSANNQGQGIFVNLAVSFVYLSVDEEITVDDFPYPVFSDYPAGCPMIFEQMEGHFTLGGSRTSFKNINIRCQNTLDVNYDESKFPQAIRWGGRNVSFGTSFRYKSDADRVALEAVSARAATISFTDGTTTTLFDFKSNNIFSGVTDSLPLGGAYYQTVENQALLTAATTDLVVTTTP